MALTPAERRRRNAIELLNMAMLMAAPDADEQNSASGAAALTLITDDLEMDPPVYSFSSTQAGTLYWDLHTSATPPAVGTGNIGSGSVPASSGFNSAEIDLTAYAGQTGYMHYRLTNANGTSNILTSQQFTVPSAWSPTSLFAAAEVGAWYDPSDTSTLWQDTAGTTPVTTLGQSVARIDDKSGNAKHLTQSDSAKRPTWQQDGAGKYYLQFDGTNDYLEKTSAAIPLVDLAVFVACHEPSAVDNQGPLSIAPSSGNDYDSTAGLVFDHGDNTCLFQATGSTSFSFNTQHTGSGACPKIVAALVKSSTSGSLYINGNNTAAATDSSFTAFSATSSGSVLMGGRYLSGAISAPYYNGRIYGIIIRGASTSNADRDEAEAWLNAKIGAY